METTTKNIVKLVVISNNEVVKHYPKDLKKECFVNYYMCTNKLFVYWHTIKLTKLLRQNNVLYKIVKEDVCLDKVTL